MNKKISLAMVTVISLAIVYSCNKNKDVSTISKFNKNAIASYTPSAELPASHFIVNAEDTIDQKVNFAIYHLTKAYCGILTSSTLTSDLISKIQAQPSKMYNLYDFADLHSSIDPMLNTYFISLLSASSSFNNRTWLGSNLVYDSSYQPYAHIANQETYNSTLPPYFVSCTQMNPDSNSSLDGFVPCWYMGSSGLRFTYIEEADIATIENPLIVIDNNVRSQEEFPYQIDKNVISNEEDDESETEEEQVEFVGSNVFAMSGFRVNKDYKYEKGISGKIDFCIRGLLSRNNTTNDYDAVQWTIKLKKNKLSTNITKYKEIFNKKHPNFPTTTGYYSTSSLVSQCFSGLATFERDPFASGKNLGYARAIVGGVLNCLGPQISMLGHRNYFGDWYSWDPNTNYFYDLNYYHPFINTSQTFSNAKGYFTVYNPQ